MLRPVSFRNIGSLYIIMPGLTGFIDYESRYSLILLAVETFPCDHSCAYYRPSVGSCCRQNLSIHRMTRSLPAIIAHQATDLLRGQLLVITIGQRRLARWLE
jgi:hypothetical protein